MSKTWISNYISQNTDERNNSPMSRSYIKMILQLQWYSNFLLIGVVTSGVVGWVVSAWVVSAGALVVWGWALVVWGWALVVWGWAWVVSGWAVPSGSEVSSGAPSESDVMLSESCAIFSISDPISEGNSPLACTSSLPEIIQKAVWIFKKITAILPSLTHCPLREAKVMSKV